MGGYGGALKNISIGLASSYGKAYIHGAGEPEKIWTANHDLFLKSMADASKSIVDTKAVRQVTTATADGAVAALAACRFIDSLQ